MKTLKRFFHQLLIKDNKEFVKYYCLWLVFWNEEAEIIREIIKDCNRDFHIYVEEKTSKTNEHGTFTTFDIYTTTLNFASLYYRLGVEVERRVLSKRVEK